MAATTKSTAPSDDTNQAYGGGAANPSGAASYQTPGADGGTMKDLWAKFNTMHQLSDAAEKYLEELTLQLKAYQDLTIKVERLQEPTGAYAFIAGSSAIILTFAEMVAAPSVPPHAPKSRNNDLAIASLARFDGNIKPITAIVVRPQDYTRAKAMAKFIGDNLTIKVNNKVPADLSVLTRGTRYAVDRSVESVKMFINQFNPHGVMPRCDVGLMVYLKMPTNDQFAREGLTETDLPVMAISAYTEMVAQDIGGVIKFMPLVRITNITTMIPIPALSLIGVYLAATHLCTDGGWIDQFRVFDKKRANLGNLVIDSETNKPFDIKSAEQLQAFIAKHCTPAMLGVDIPEGQAFTPALRSLNDQVQGAGNLISYINNFFKGELRLTSPVTQWHKTEFLGFYGDNGMEDTRKITYLDQLAKNAPFEQARALQQWVTDPSQRAAMISDWTGGFESVYQNTTAVISPHFLVNFGQVVAQANIAITTNQQAQGHASLSGLMDSAQHMMNLQHITTPTTPGWNFNQAPFPSYQSGF